RARVQRVALGTFVSGECDQLAFLVTLGYPRENCSVSIEGVEVYCDHSRFCFDDDVEASRGVVGSGDRITRFGQILLGQKKRGGITVDYQRRPVRIGERTWSLACRRQPALDFNRQRHGEHRALALTTHYTYLAAEQLNKPSRYGQAQSGSGSCAASGRAHL